MLDVKDKIITSESLKALHDYNKETYLPFSGGTLTGDLNGTNIIMTGAITANTVTTDSSLIAKGSIIGYNGIEIYGNGTPYIDFHFNNDTTADYTSRIRESESGVLSLNGVKCQTGGNLSFNGMLLLSSAQYGNTLPTAGNKGRIFFKKLSE